MSKKPTLIAYSVKEREGQKAIWTKIGAAWPHGSGRRLHHPARSPADRRPHRAHRAEGGRRRGQSRVTFRGCPRMRGGPFHFQSPKEISAMKDSNITPGHVRAFQAVTSQLYDNVTLWSCRINGEPGVAIVMGSQRGGSSPTSR